MSRVAENALHRAVDAKIEASERAKAAPPADTWGSERWGCRACPARPIGGYFGPIAAVMAQSSRHGVVVWCREVASRETFVCCGENCAMALAKEVTRGTAPAFERLVVPIAPVAPVAPAPQFFRSVVDAHLEGQKTRRVTLRCARTSCASEQRIEQQQRADGAWSPSAEHVAKVGGWDVSAAGTFCGGGCRTWHAHDLQVAAERKPVVALGEVNDVTYRRSLARSRAVDETTPAAPPSLGSPAAPAAPRPFTAPAPLATSAPFAPPNVTPQTPVAAAPQAAPAAVAAKPPKAPKGGSK